MKEVIAVVRMNMMNQTKKALTDAGVDAFFAHEANGRGKGFVLVKLAQIESTALFVRAFLWAGGFYKRYRQMLQENRLKQRVT